MGDRTNVIILCRKQDVDAIKEALDREFEDEVANAGDCIELYHSEMTPDTSLMPDTIPYIYTHGYGHEYGPWEAVCDGTEKSEREQGHDGGYVLFWDQRETSLQAIEKHVALKARVQQMLEAESASA